VNLLILPIIVGFDCREDSLPPVSAVGNILLFGLKLVWSQTECRRSNALWWVTTMLARPNFSKHTRQSWVGRKM